MSTCYKWRWRRPQPLLTELGREELDGWGLGKSLDPKPFLAPDLGHTQGHQTATLLWSSVSPCIKQKSAYMTLMMTCGHHTLTCDTFSAHLVSQGTSIPRGAFQWCWKETVLDLLLLENGELPARTQKSLGYMSSVALVRISFLNKKKWQANKCLFFVG